MPEFSPRKCWFVSDSDHSSGPEPGELQGPFLYVVSHVYRVEDGICTERLGSLPVKMSRAPISQGPRPPVLTSSPCTDQHSTEDWGAPCALSALQTPAAGPHSTPNSVTSAEGHAGFPQPHLHLPWTGAWTLLGSPPLNG